MNSRHAVFFLLASVLSTGCATRRITTVSNAAPRLDASNYIDLQPGWRLQATIPIVRSGTSQDASGSPVGKSAEDDLGDPQRRSVTMVAHADNNFLGYETAYYSVEPMGSGVRVQFRSAVDKIGKETLERPKPRLDILRIPRGYPFARLLYLVRVSESDHNMAVLAADDPAALRDVTGRVSANPASCTRGRHSFCAWIPAGIAVLAEHKKPGEGAEEWEPAR